MKVSARVDIEAVVDLTAAVLRQLPYAANNAITRVAKLAVDAGQKELAADLMIRKRFILSRVKVLQYSRVNDLTAIVGIDPRVQGAPLLLGFLEMGGEKTPTKGPEIAVPLTGESPRPTFGSSVRRGYYYANLHFADRKGWHRTYIIPGVGIFQRIRSLGKRAQKKLGVPPEAKLSDSVLIYSFRPAAPLPPHIHLRNAMIEIIGTRFAPIFTEEFTAEILRRARR